MRICVLSAARCAAAHPLAALLAATARSFRDLLAEVATTVLLLASSVLLLVAAALAKQVPPSV